MVRLNAEEKAMLAGEAGRPRQLAIRQQIDVARFFDAPDFVRITQVHLNADTESLGEAGVRRLEALARCPAGEREVVVPTITDPRGLDFCAYKQLKQEPRWAALEERAMRAFRRMGILLTDTCINYQSIRPPTFGEHLAFGDTGSVVYANSVCGARSNFEGGPAALAAALTGRVPRYGYHLDRHRRATCHFEVGTRMRDLSDWGALGAIVGQRAAPTGRFRC